MNKKNILLSLLLIECTHVISLQAMQTWFKACLNTAYNLASNHNFVQTAIQFTQATHQMHIFGYDEQTALSIKDARIQMMNHYMQLVPLMIQVRDKNNEYFKQLSPFDGIRVIQLGFLVAPKNRGIGMNK